ncbi:guanylate kinase [Moraxella bovoculi]|uniref:Guanylate kinase n=1 Tax=Moraxella bovoculi TaxID=386891 RepID=A0AAC8PVW6_9GAMM|nr:guanylate kinase [Moraxella bovoculi]AKG07332.1 guanylate kinase [Moraxella bovoculi]AKG10062.1 guanylate kinase [Moraxella bovoculi]AKG11985.1 guanylate kinase [Moraxella bovoculi]AKG13951.1 guanylate kinase [Moraxella bovoculi]
MSAQGTLFIITAASGTGKTSLVKELLATTDNLKVSISHTTRQPRPAESDGVHYYFTDKTAFEQLISKGAFFEYAEVFGNYYGTSEQAVDDLLNQGIDVILEIDWQGALQVKEKSPQAVMIFILPPSRDALRSRLSNRGQDSSDVIETRLAGAVTEMKNYHHFDYVVINDDFSTALGDLQTIIKAQRLTLTQQTARQNALIKSLLSD